MNRIKGAKWLDKNIPSCEGKVFLITGCTSGIGLASLKALLYKGAKVIMAIRNKEKALKVLIDIEKEIGEKPKAEIAIYNQADFSSFRKMAETIKNEKIDAFILNSAIYFPKPGSVGEDGTSLTYYVNTIGCYGLTKVLYEYFPNSRYVFCGSIANKTPKTGSHSYYVGNNHNQRFDEYGVSKRGVMNIMAYFLDKGMKAYLTTPGISGTSIFGQFTPILKKAGSVFLNLVVHKPWKACLGEVLCAAKENIAVGSYYVPRGLDISGYPRKKKLPKSAKKLSVDLIENIEKANYCF